MSGTAKRIFTDRLGWLVSGPRLDGDVEYVRADLYEAIVREKHAACEKQLAADLACYDMKAQRDELRALLGAIISD